jgi:hypothetical protein
MANGALEHEDRAHIARWDPDRVRLECAAKRAIIALHESWPVLVETEPEFESPLDIAGMTVTMSKRIAWMTEREYRTRFGTESPTAPILRALAAVYADHPDFRAEWR